ncbi:uncharacterized protein SOCE26_057740 [Sorangium cellulosum]|uniref:Secreted protein n=1 Tax=Sorangium cellulosum TaxID=56 RepID=A0A2L0EYF1_SORCE|nr:hypothetical protein [Sorangium cellulosum]AUX44310.1 uncharacterized protein SOCE26_057740 [Sorangium cellulosum]
MIYRIPGLVVLCGGLSMAGAGAGCIGAGDDAPSLEGPALAVQAAGAGSDGSGSASGGLAGAGEASAGSGIDVMGVMDAVQAVWANGLSADALTHNALITNPRANPVMVDFALSTANYDDVRGQPELRRQLRHAPTREVMKYLVSCALERGQSVSYIDTSTGEKYTFPGEIGICPHWAEGGVGSKCQELVSACLISRVNAEGRHVTLSIRGQAFPEHRPGLLSPASSVRVVTATEEGDLIPSFARCARDASGASRDCGWTAGHVGSCTPGSYVFLGAGSEPLGDCEDDPSSAAGLPDGDTVIRVCDGIRGCDTSSTGYLEQNEVRCSGRGEPALHFSCPSSGHFSVMSGPSSVRPGAAAPLKGVAAVLQRHRGFSVASRLRVDPDPPPGAVSIIEASFEPAVYPAPEASVFRWREGAFYGKLWGKFALNPLITVGLNEVKEDGSFRSAPRTAGGVVFTHAFACTGEYWTEQAAYVGHRLCAGAGAEKDCVAHSLGACREARSFTDCPSLYQCSVADGGLVEGDGDIQECKGSGGGTWHHPLTVFLNHPSDVIRDSPFAAVVHGAMVVEAPLCPGSEVAPSSAERFGIR